jgi:predicted transcriptional regulator of viral defense system
MMLYNWNEIVEEYGYPLRVREAVKSGEIYRVGRGLYSDKPFVNPFGVAAARYPYAIITMDTAFYIHGLTDVIPDKTFLATKRNATRITDDGVVQAFLNDMIFEPGRMKMDYDGATINVYDRERMLVECMRSSKSLPFDYYKEIIASYRKISGELDMQKIENYISLFKRNDYLFNILQREVL